MSPRAAEGPLPFAGWRLVLTFGRDHHERFALLAPGEPHPDDLATPTERTVQ